jgi:uncharacterized protein (DUF4415 family)
MGFPVYTSRHREPEGNTYCQPHWFEKAGNLRASASGSDAPGSPARRCCSKRMCNFARCTFSKAKRGAAVAVPKGKSRITIRLDDAIIDWFKTQVEEAGGGNYQSLINAALREHIGRLDEPLEKTLRRVLREELRKAS